MKQLMKTTATPITVPKSISFSALPRLGEALADGTFHGVITSKDGTRAAVVLLAAKPSKRLTWEDAKAWAGSAGGQLPSRPVSALLYANAKHLFRPTWHWTSEERHADTDTGDASSAWYCIFTSGFQYFGPKSAEGAAVAVRLIPLSH